MDNTRREELLKQALEDAEKGGNVFLDEVAMPMCAPITVNTGEIIDG